MSKQIESKVSVTAKGTCLMRAISYSEKDKRYKSDDYIAPQLIHPFLSALAKCDMPRAILKKLFFKAPGIYEYVIARTKFIDDVFRNLGEEFEQVLIFGAGFDSRVVRFHNQLKNVKIFELDGPATQHAKISRLTEKNIILQPNLEFISLDFTQESLADKLEEAGFERNKTCLFILEGLTYYLDQPSIDGIFRLLSEYSGKDSLVVFDYAVGVAEGQGHISDDAEMKKYSQALAKAGEKPGFIIEGAIKEFLDPYGFKPVDEAGSAELAERYFGKKDFRAIARRFILVKAMKQ